MKVFVVVCYDEDDLYTQEFEDVFATSDKAEKFVKSLDGVHDELFVDWVVERDADGDIITLMAKVMTNGYARTKYLIMQKKI